MVFAGAAVVSIVALLLFGRSILSWWARQMALRRMNAGTISEAQQWLARSARFDADDGKTELMKAACFRRLYRQEGWSKALESAERKGASAARIRQERKLGLIQSGEFGEEANELVTLLEGGVSQHEVCAAFVHGYLARGDPQNAKLVLDAWAADYPEGVHVAYMRGVYEQWLGEGAGVLTQRHAHFNRAQAEYETALAAEPRHELARTALAELFEEQDRLEEAARHYAALARHSPENENGKVGLARLLRELGHVDQARAVLEPLTLRPEVPLDVAAELGHVELESGNYAEAESWFGQAGLERTEDYGVLRGAATAWALEEKTTGAGRLFIRHDTLHGRTARTDDLVARLATGHLDQEAVDELERLSRPPADASVVLGERAGGDRHESPRESARELYALHCSACHGDDGNGYGRAARHLFPRPRDLRTGRSRLVSTRNGVPTLEDLEAVLRRGMAGTSMRSFENLTLQERKLLAEEVTRLNREGIREQFADVLRRDGEELDEDEIRQTVELCTVPGEPVRVPPIGPADSGAIARGQKTYIKLGCDHCHGDDGTGLGDSPLFDDKGRPSPARDLVHEPLKGGEEAESIYVRILVGMPGSPHPGCGNLSKDQLVDVVHYCRGLSRDPKRSVGNHQRAVDALRGAASGGEGRAAQPADPSSEPQPTASRAD